MENNEFEDANIDANLTRVLFEDEAIKTDSSFFANWEVVSTIPKCYGEEVSFQTAPYKSRIKI